MEAFLRNAGIISRSVGSADPAYDDQVTLRVLVTAPREERLCRGLARDGEALRGHWERWQVVEAAHLGVARTLERADVVVDGLTGRLLSPGDV